MNTSEKIESLRARYGSGLLVLAHHYQRPEVVAHADFKGDSLELARKAAASTAERIVFCGVRFMAESADILTSEKQTVYASAPEADCPMARMAEPNEARRALEELASVVPGAFVPVVYVNSTVEIKAFCGENGGMACTSGNAARVFRSLFESGRRIFFLPDQHLGINTATDLGLRPGEIAVYDRRKAFGGLSREDVASARVVVWNGFCPIHAKFRPADVASARAGHPEARVIVHPEAPRDVVESCDGAGSTAKMIQDIAAAPAGSSFVVGTERKLVERLAKEQAARGISIVPLVPGAECMDMSLTTEEGLLSLLESFPESHRVRVDPALAAPARRCLERMLALP